MTRIVSNAPQTLPRGAVGAGERVRSAVLAVVVCVGLYGVGALYLLARVLPQFNSAIPGSGIAIVDGWQNTWNMWWVRLALSRGQNPYVTDVLFYPNTQSLYLHTLNITNSLLTLPAQLIAGPIVAYNVAIFLGIVLTGLATYLLTHYVVGHRGVAIVVGAFVTFSPFHVAKVVDGHLSWVTLFWIPAYLLCLLRSLDGGGRRWTILAGVLLAGATLTSYYYAVFSALFTALLLLVRLPAALREGRWRHEIISTLLIGALSAVLVSPVLIPALGEYEREASGWDRETATYSADLVDLIFPSPFHPWWGEWAIARHAEMRYGWFWTISPGFGVLALAGIGSALAGRRARPWLALALILWVLTLGPKLRVLGVETGVPMPFDLLRFIPGMTLGHRPNHLIIYLLPVIGILAGLGMVELLRRGWRGRLVAGLLGALVAVELLVLPIPAMPFPSDPVLAQVRDRPGAVMDLPNLQRNAPAMQNQMVHGRPIIGGYLARPTGNPSPTQRVPWLRQVWRLKPEPAQDIVVQQPDAGYQAFSIYGVRTIIVRRNDMTPEEASRFQQALEVALPGITPAYSGPRVDVYTIDTVPSPRTLAFLGSGWYDFERSDPNMWRWMSGEATLYAMNPTDTPVEVTLRLTAQSYLEERPLELSLDGQPLGSYSFAPALQTIEVRFVLEPGEHTIGLKSTTTLEPTAAQRTLSLMVTQIAVEPD